MSGSRFAIEFLFYLLSCLIAIISFVYINYVFARKSFSSIINVLISYIFYFIMLLWFFLLPRIYIDIIACFPSSAWACDDAAISLIFWVFLVFPCYVILNITLFTGFGFNASNISSGIGQSSNRFARRSEKKTDAVAFLTLAR